MRALIIVALSMGLNSGLFAEEPAEKCPPLPVAVSSLGAAVCDGWVYVYGGHSGKTHTYSTEDVVGSFYRFKLHGGREWEKLPGGPPLQGLALVGHQGKVYRIGGMQPRNKPGEKTDNHSLKECACYDPESGKWERLPDLPAGRSSHDAAVLGDRIYVVGGWEMKGSGVPPTWHDTAQVLDLTKRPLKWESIEQPFHRRAFGVVGFAGKVYVLGGLSDADIERTVEVYDPPTNTWSEGPALPGLRRNSFSPAACVVDGKLVISPPDGRLYQLNESGHDWQPFGRLRQNRMVHRIVPHRNGILVLGGASREGNLKSIEVHSLIND